MPEYVMFGITFNAMNYAHSQRTYLNNMFVPLECAYIIFLPFLAVSVVV
jgi:hypothetical protein